MTEKELFKRTLEEHFLDKQEIRLSAMRTVPLPQTGGRYSMKKRITAIAAAAVVLCTATFTVFAVTRLMSANEAAKALDKPALASAFTKDGAVSVDDSVTSGGYTVTFLGLTSGSELDESISDVEADKTYAVVAIEREDNKAMTGTEQFFVSPLIGGLNPALYNIVTMNGGYTEKVMDGVLYRIIDCDSVEIFADRGLYLAVADGTFYNNNTLNVNESTGELSVNKAYSGLSALFKLPIDAAKADKTLARVYLDNMFKEEDKGEVPAVSGEMASYDEMTAQNVIETGTVIEDSVKTVKVDSKGFYNYSYQTADGAGASFGIASSVFESNKAGEPFVYGYSVDGNGTENRAIFQIFTLNDDNSLTIALYEVK